jgi:hypothetical protein
MEHTGRENRTGDQGGGPGDRELLPPGLLRKRLKTARLISRIDEAPHYTGGFSE